jgi:hypothetical protein
MTTVKPLPYYNREYLRWVLLQSLYHARPVGANEDLLARILHDLRLDTTRTALRQELDYLRGLGLITVHGDPEPWHAAITPAGVDVVEYNAPAPPGIARPPKYWEHR